MKKIIVLSTIIISVLLLLCACGTGYVVTFDKNGGELGVESLELKYNKSYSLPVPKLAGYQFQGWYYGEELIPQTGKWQFEEDISLKAKWEFMQYQIIYELDGGVLENQVPGFNYDTPTFVVPVPKKEGYVFSHWEDENGNKYEGDFTVNEGTSKDIYLKAVWWDFEEDGVRYLYENNALTVYTYEGSGDQEIVIPNEILGKPVVKIREGAFRELGKRVAGGSVVYKVFLPDSIEFVGKNAFYECSNIKVVYSTSANEDYITLATEWLKKVVIEEQGNEHFADVILRKRPTFNSSEYVQIEK